MYWDAANVKLDQITFYPLEDATTMMNLYKAGEVDAAVQPHPCRPRGSIICAGLKDYMDKPESAIEYYMLNTTKPPMDDVRVRKAFNMAIDKVGAGRVPAHRQAADGVHARRHLPRLSAAERRSVRSGARASSCSPKPAIATPAATTIRRSFPIADVELTYNTTERNRQIAEFVQAQWKQNLGLTVPLKNMEWKTFLDYRAKLEYKGVARAGLGRRLHGSVHVPRSVHDDDRRQRHRVVRPEVRRRCSTRPTAQPDPQKRYELLAKAEAMLLDAQPVIPLYTHGRRTG